MENLFEAWCRDSRNLSFGEYLDDLYRAWDRGQPTRLGQDVLDLYNECHRRIRGDLRFALAFLGIDRFVEDWASRHDGDQVLAVLRRALTEVLQARGRYDDVCAELGGANFLILLAPTEVSSVCSDILEQFDQRVASLKPVPKVSIGVAGNEERRIIVHFGQVLELAQEMRRYAETQPGSVFVVDRRVDR